MKTWAELHELKNFDGIENELTLEQKALIIVANGIDHTTFFLSESGFNVDRATELSKKLHNPSRLAEYLELKIASDDLRKTAVFVASISIPEDLMAAMSEATMKD